MPPLHNFRSSLISQTLLRIQEILFQKPMILPCVKTTSIYSLYNFYRARMILSRVRISWFIGFYRASRRDFRLDCSCYTWAFRAEFQDYFQESSAIAQSCYCLICLSSALADSSSNPFPSVFEISDSSTSFFSVNTLSLPFSSVFSTSSPCALSDNAEISIFNFLMNQVFSSRYFLIQVFDLSYLSIIFLLFNSFSFNQSAIFSKLSRSSSNFFFRVQISFSFCWSLVRQTDSFFQDQDSWDFRFQTQGLVVLDYRLRISKRIFFYYWRLVARRVFSLRSFYSFMHFSCRFLVYLESSQVCCLRVERISLQLSSLALRDLTSVSYFLICQ